MKVITLADPLYSAGFLAVICGRVEKKIAIRPSASSVIPTSGGQMERTAVSTPMSS